LVNIVAGDIGRHGGIHFSDFKQLAASSDKK